MKIAGLFSGIGGLELPFHRHGAETAVLCDIWEPSRRVLADRFPGTLLNEDIRTLQELPQGTTVVTAGFPCTDLSQAGRTAGIGGQESGLVAHVFRLLQNRAVEWLILENVRNMLVLDRGRAMAYLISELESLGFRWAYRLVDSRFSGVPQRRHRVLFAASRHHDPRNVLFADDAGEPDPSVYRDDAYGFYWTEGFTGLGWAQDAVPPLKGGSGLGIPSPPGIWMPNAEPGEKLVTPGIEAAESLQGFDRGWTEAASTGKRPGPRWKLIGNAVTVGVAAWLVDRLGDPGDVVVHNQLLHSKDRWPNAAYGHSGKIWAFAASSWPTNSRYRHLLEVLTPPDLEPLSQRATEGFLSRATRSRLAFNPDFLQDLKEHIAMTRGRPPVTNMKFGSSSS